MMLRDGRAAGREGRVLSGVPVFTTFLSESSHVSARILARKSISWTQSGFKKCARDVLTMAWGLHCDLYGTADMQFTVDDMMECF